jgi:hypothetical protein
MRHLTAAQKGEGGGWHYVSLHRKRGGYPLGYCASHEPHETEKDARECYAMYQRDHVKLDGLWADWAGCQAPGCDAPTQTHARIEGDGFHAASLCKDHLDYDHAVAALGLDSPAGDAWVS